MAHRFAEKTESSSSKESWLVLVTGETIGMLTISLFLLLGAAVFWLTDKFSPNFASSAAQGKSDFLSYLFGAALVVALAATHWYHKYGYKYKRKTADEREAEA